MQARHTTIDLQGHRGARGLLPENSIPAFRRALELGVTTLEMDVVISADDQVVVSHEPWFSGVICRTPAGDDIRPRSERSYNIFRLTYDEIERFDCGSRGHPSFPEQQRIPVAKPRLVEVIEMAEEYAVELGRPAPRYNIEIKSEPSRDGIFHPPPERFARLLYDVLEAHQIVVRSTIQSFDVRSLRAVRDIDPSVTLSLLTDNRRSFEGNMEALGFLPNIYSPNYKRVSKKLIDSAHEAGVEVKPWTVNDSESMTRLLEMGVDGLITDYPNIGGEVIATFRRAKQQSPPPDQDP